MSEIMAPRDIHTRWSQNLHVLMLHGKRDFAHGISALNLQTAGSGLDLVSVPGAPFPAGANLNFLMTKATFLAPGQHRAGR